jgi:hypothetical protein
VPITRTRGWYSLACSIYCRGQPIVAANPSADGPLSPPVEQRRVIIAALLSLIGWVIIRIFTPRGKLAWGVSHQHVFLLNNPQPSLVYIKELWIQNIGRAPVQGIEVVLAAPPHHFDIWPQRNFNNLQNPSGNFVINVDNLNRREYFTVSMLNVAAETSVVTNVRWNGGIGRQLPMAPQQAFSRRRIRLLGSLMLFGVFSLLYFMARGAVAL